MTGLVVDDVTVRFGEVVALDRFSLEAASGEIVAVVGPSGSGKSTLLRAVAGLEPLVGGRVLLDGRDLAPVPTHRRGLGLMFQDHGLFSHLSVADNIAYGLRIAGRPKPEQRRRVTELLELVGLGGYGERRTTELSGGEAQRVALARALAPEPGLLMLDEPLGSLDRALRDQLTGDLRRLLNRLGQTALHVTHDQAEAFALADRVAVVANGRPMAIGTPAELWADPGSRFVARFLGHPNIWSISVTTDGAVLWSGRPLGALAPEHRLRSMGPGDHVVVMPAAGIAVCDPAGSVHPGRWTVDVDVVEVVFRRGFHDVTARRSTAGAEPGQTIGFTTSEPLEPGRTVTVSIDPSGLRAVSN